MSKAAGGGMANGPGQSDSHVGRDSQVWERPWSLEEMRQSSATWSLAADSGLYLFLQDFSQRMLSKTHEIEKQLDGLIRDTKATDATLHSVFNDFLMLSNTQFIENRVYDEEIEDPAPKTEALDKQPEPEKTREQKEAELIPKMQEAVNYGLKVLDSAFEQLDIKAGNSDSEDDDTTDRVDAILEPKDLYVDRPLPYLIGSQAFMEHDDVGLGDLSSDEMSMDSDRDSVMESEDEKDEQSEEDFDREANGSIKKKLSMRSYDDDEEEDEDSDIFGESEKEDDDDEEDDQKSLCHIQNTAAHQATFADELAARIKGDPPVCKAEPDRTSLTSKKKSKSKKDQKPSRAAAAADDDNDDMFKPPKMEDDDFSPFGGRGGLFSGGRGLFDDDDEGDLFSDAPKPARPEEKNQSTKHTTENSLFTSKEEEESAESQENGSPGKPRTPSAPRPVLAGGGGGLFDDDEEEDDFFTGKKSTKTPNTAGQDRPKAKTTVDLFGGDEAEDEEDEGDIFSEKSSAPPPQSTVAPPPPAQSTVVGEDLPKAPEKKMPAGAISMFGPGTKNLLSEALKKRQPSPSCDSDRSDENGPPPDVEKVPSTQTHRPATRGLFSDDEDSQIIPSLPKSRSQPEPSSHAKTSKAPLSLFDDDEEEDLFASAAKSKRSAKQAKATTPQPKKTASSSLFSDDEDQWLNSKAGAETKTGGMKSSVSAPSSLPSAITSQKGSLFDDDEDDDLFAATKVSSQKKHHRVALLFEDEGAGGGDDDDDGGQGSLFGSKPADVISAATPANQSAAAAPPPTPAHPSLPQRTEAQLPSTPAGVLPAGVSEGRKKPPGAVSLFGGIDVLASKQPKKSLASDQAEPSESIPSGGDGPPSPASHERTVPLSPTTREEKKANKTKAVSLFDQEDDQDEDAEGSAAATPAAKNTLKAAPETTGVFQDEELLFSRTQQKDNDPDVDLFSTSGRAVSTKAAAPSLFADDDDDDLFTSIKPKAPPKVAEKPSKPKDDAPLKAASPAPELLKPPATSPAPEPLKPPATSPAPDAHNPPAISPAPDAHNPPATSPAPDTHKSPATSPEPEPLKPPATSPAPDTHKPPANSPQPDAHKPPATSPEPEPLKPPATSPAPDAHKSPATSPASTPENEKPAASPVKSKEPSSRIGKLQANLVINPAALLPGAVPRVPAGAVGVLPGPATGSSSGVSSSSLTPSPTTPVRTPQTDGREGGTGFESPVQVATLQSANKSRAKGSVRRRPQSRAARQQAAQTSGEDGQEDTLGLDEDRRVPSLSPMASSPQVQPAVRPTLADSASGTALPSQPPVAAPGRPSVLTLPVSTHSGQKPSSTGSDHKATPPPQPDDLFASDGLFGSTPATNHARPASRTAAKKPVATQQSKTETSSLPSIFDDHGKDDLFRKVKPRSTAKKAKASSSFLEEDDGDIFGTPALALNKEAKSSAALTQPDIFQDEDTSVPKAPKNQSAQALDDASLFDKKQTAQDATLFDKKQTDASLFDTKQTAEDATLFDKQTAQDATLFDTKQTAEDATLFDKQTAQDASLFDTKQTAEDATLFDKKQTAQDASLFDKKQTAQDASLFDKKQTAQDATLFDKKQTAQDASLFDKKQTAQDASLFDKKQTAQDATLFDKKQTAQDASLFDKKQTAQDATLLDKKQTAQDATLFNKKQADASLLDKKQNDASLFDKKQTDASLFDKKQTDTSLFDKKQTDTSLFDKKQTAQSLDASLFDDNIDIFADLTPSAKPKDKSKKKMETKSIFDDDMDDIFSVKPVTKAPSKSRKTPTSLQDTSMAEDPPANIFDDPLNALGGN